MTRKFFTNDSRKKGLCTRQLLALVLAFVFATSTAFTFAACGNKAEETDVDLTEAETISADDETTTDDAEEETGEVSEENTENDTDESTEAGDEESDAAEGEKGDTEDGESTTVLDDTTKAVSVTETTTGEKAATTTADSNGYTYTSMSDTIMYVKKSVNVRSIPSQDGTKLGSLSAGTPVTVTGQCNETGWYRIAFNGGTGYVSNNYLTSNKSEVETTTQTSTTTKSESSITTKKSSESSTTTKKSTETTTTKKTTYSSMTEKYIALGINSLTSSEIQTLLTEFSDAVVELVNEERAAAGLPAYKTSSLLNEAAAIRAEELATSFAHTRPDGTSCFTVLREVGFLYTDCGENAAEGQVTPTQVMTEWMNSSGHKANILNQPFVMDDSDDGYTYVTTYADGFYGYDTIGVGVYYEDGVFYWVQLFAHSHTHTWYEWEDDDGNTIWCCCNPYYSNIEAGFYALGCSFWKDASGVIHEEWLY